MNNISLKCPYCNIELNVSSGNEGNRAISLRCKYCYGIFSFLPANRHVSFKKNRSYYEVFGLEKVADLSSIKGRYRNLALKFHPDRHKNKEFANDKMKQVNYIYSILADNNLRRQYDSTLDFDETFENIFSKYVSPTNIYQDYVDIADSSERIVKVASGDYIYFPMEQCINLFGKQFSIPLKGYLGVKVHRIFNPQYKNKYEEVLKKILDKEPLFFVSFGAEEMIIYKEDFQRIWIGQKTLNVRDTKTALIYAVVIISLIIAGIAHLYSTYTCLVNDDGNVEVIRKIE
jgi:curved DNA-binding protein CbpA